MSRLVAAVGPSRDGPLKDGPLTDWLNTSGFTPHGFCLSWDPDVMAAMVLANGIIAFSYIALALLLARAAIAPRPAVPRWLYWSFSAFIFCCGVSHVIDDVTLWLPVYRLQALELCLTAAISLLAAVLPVSVWVSHEVARWRR